MNMTDEERARSAARYARERTATDVEHRTTISPVTLRAKQAGDSGQTFEGYAVKYNSATWIGYGDDDPWGFWEQIAPGAFDMALRSVDVVCLYNHDLNYMLGRTASGTLRLTTDDTGLLAVNDLPDTTVGRDLGVLVGRQDVAGMSFSFIPIDERWTIGADGKDRREVLSVGENLFDVAPCVLPAYGDTTAAVRAVSIGRRNAPRKPADTDERSVMQPEGGEPEIDEPEEWRDLQRDSYTRLMFERGNWDLSE